MKVYADAQRHFSGIHTIHIQPGKEYPETGDWCDALGNPILISVEFKNGIAEVEGNIGKYLIEKNLARKTKPIIQH